MPARHEVIAEVMAWFAAHARPLPWREPDCSAWGIMVSEYMLQQTPVTRVLPVWQAWLERWPTPAALADDEPGDAVRAWGRLGYPRRAQRLHAAATVIRDEHSGEVPTDATLLRSLPGVGDYTAAAIASFAHGQRHVVLDTNVRRVLARLEGAQEFPPASLTRAERERAAAWLPDEPVVAAAWAAASMELGALVCTADNPACGACPVSRHCAWLAAGRPAWDGPPRKGQTYAGTDRQCRGALLAVLRAAERPVTREHLLTAWPVDPGQAERSLASLLTDGLARAGTEGITL